MECSPETHEYKLTDLDYLTGDHHLQMMKAALPYLGVSQQKALSLFVKVQELRRTARLFETEETASLGICSLARSGNRSPKGGRKLASFQEILEAIRPYANPSEQDMIDMTGALLQGQTPAEQMKRFLSPKQQSQLETVEMLLTAMQAMA